MLKFQLVIYCVCMVTQLLGQLTTFSNPLVYAGRMEGVPFELEILTYNPTNEEFTGRYKYIQQNKYLSLKGSTYEHCMEITETYKGKVTGSFYLEMNGNGCIGYWSNGERAREVEMSLIKGNRADWKIPLFTDKIIQENSTLSGTYETQWSFVNSQFYPAIEIGSNTCILWVEEINKQTIQFSVEAVCGPTYHFAFAEGVAIKQNNIYLFESTNDYSEKCVIKFKFTANKVEVEANESTACGFGARAYLDHELHKISHTIPLNKN
jgi:hypothetical protein